MTYTVRALEGRRQTDQISTNHHATAAKAAKQLKMMWNHVEIWKHEPTQSTLVFRR